VLVNICGHIWRGALIQKLVNRLLIILNRVNHVVSGQDITMRADECACAR